MDARLNFAASLVATAPTPATSGTSLTVTAGQGALFPTAPFDAVVCPAGTSPTTVNAEVVRVTARTTDTLTITRAQEGSTARTIIATDQIYAGVTKKTLDDIADVSLYRVSAGRLKTDEMLFSGSILRARDGAAAQITIGDDPTTPRILFGNADDTNLFRQQANVLTTDDIFTSAANIYAQQNAASQVIIGNSGPGAVASVVFGSAVTAALYLQTATALSVNGAHLVVDPANVGYKLRFFDPNSDGYGALYRDNGTGRLTAKAQNDIALAPQIGGKVYFTDTTAMAMDTVLYRAAADSLKTDDSFTVGGSMVGLGSVYADYNNIGGKLYFGSLADTALYRHAAGVLRTDQVLLAGPGGGIAANKGGVGTEPQIEFAYNGSIRQYRHMIGSSHNGGADSGNFLDFRLWKVGDTADTLGQSLACRMYAAGHVMIGYGLGLGGQVPTGHGIQFSDGTVQASASPIRRWGIISSTGTVTAGTGFTVAKGGGGVYTVTFSPALSTLTALVCVVTGPTPGYACTVSVTSRSATGFAVELRDNTTSAGAVRDLEWSFIATGT